MLIDKSRNSTVYIPRLVENRVKTALADTRIVAIVGPRQSGKTTLAKRLAKADERPYLTLDETDQREFAIDDPDGFLRDYESVVIDEVQRAPELFLTMKRIVDDDPRPGRFLITGSVDLLQRSVSPDSLAGRIEVIELLPFSQAELCHNATPGILDRLFSCDFPVLETVGRSENLVERVLRGGYPIAVERSDDNRREQWLRTYAELLTNRDLPEIARINKSDQLNKLIDLAAVYSGNLLNHSAIGLQIGIDSKTAERWLSLLESLFLVRRVGAWHHNERKRPVKSQKLQFIDSGLLAAMRRINAKALQRDRTQFGALLESFVFSEILKVAAIRNDRININHYRDQDKTEVDFVIECAPGQIVGIEVKARATVRPNDFKGLKRLMEINGKQFSCGAVMYDGEKIQQLHPNMFAIPFKMLWEA